MTTTVQVLRDVSTTLSGSSLGVWYVFSPGSFEQAIEAAAKALPFLPEPDNMPILRETARDVLTAALPHLEQALRAQIAAEISCVPPDTVDPDWKEKIAIARQARKAARQRKGPTK